MRTVCPLLLAGVLLGGIACDGDDPFGPRSESIQTDHLSYAVRTDPGLWATEVGYTYTNRTRRTVFFWHCQHGREIRLEKRVDDGWITAWVPDVPQCLPPLTAVEPGASVDDVFHVRAGFPGSQQIAPFAFDDPEGEYRLVWDLHVEADILSDLIPMESRVSNTFQFVLED
jgi:hypothetical protein